MIQSPTVIKDFLTINPFSRSGYQREVTQAVILHWVANPGTSAKMNRDYFESLKKGPDRYASTQYIVGLKGEIIQCMPINEIAYSVGAANKIDPISKKYYTDIARELFEKKFVEDREHYSPSYGSVSIEMCHPDWTGKFNEETISSVATLTAFLFQQFGLTDVQKRLITHHDVVGWKDCPRWFVNNPDELNKFKLRVEELMKG